MQKIRFKPSPLMVLELSKNSKHLMTTTKLRVNLLFFTVSQEQMAAVENAAGGASLTAYEHNVSPIKRSRKVPYFDMHLQAKEDLVRRVCFSLDRHVEFKTAGEVKSPLKVTHFTMDISDDECSLLMFDDVQLEKVDQPDFLIKEMAPFENLSSLPKVSIKQLITVKAKVAQQTALKKLHTQDGERSKVEAFLCDPFATVRAVFWGHFATVISDGVTYLFTNLRVHRDDEANIYLTTESCTSIEETEAFGEPVIKPSELPEAFTNITHIGDVIGIEKFVTYYACCKCNKKQEMLNEAKAHQTPREMLFASFDEVSESESHSDSL